MTSSSSTLDVPNHSPPRGPRRTRRRRGNGTSTTSSNTALYTLKNLLNDDNIPNLSSPSSPSMQKSDDCGAGTSSSTRSLLVQEFHTACRDSKIASMEFWKSQPEHLASVIVSASYHLSEYINGSVDHSSLLLDGIASSLLPVCTQMVQCALQQKEDNVNSHTSSQQSLLFVAIHSLRAIVRRLGPKHVEKVLKTLYHAVILSSELAILHMPSENTALYPSKTRPSIVFADLCWKAMEAKKAALLTSYCRQSEDVRGSEFGEITGTTEYQNGRNQRYVGFYLPPKTEAQSLFPIPRPWNASTTDLASSFVLLEIPLPKLVPIVVQACMAVVKLIFQLTPPIKGGSPEESELVDLVETWRNRRSNVTKCASYVTLQQWGVHLISNTAMEWIRMYPPSSHESQMGLAKKVYRIVWDRASVYTKQPEEALHLRQVALRILLLQGSNGNETRGIDRECASRLRKTGVWETVCTSAWKVACTFHRQQSASWSSNAMLTTFHDKVGKILDTIAMGLPLPYMEYCAYRLFHLKDGRSRATGSVYRDDGSETFAFSKDIMNLLSVCCDVKNALLKEEITQTASKELFSSALKIAKKIDFSILESLPEDHLRRILKLFNTVGLHRAIYSALSGEQSTLLNASYTVNAAACLSVKCLGPFYLRMVQITSPSADMPSKIAEWELYVENMIRGISAHEWMLRNGQESVRKDCDNAMLGITNVLTKHGGLCPPLSCIEKTAKVRCSEIWLKIVVIASKNV